MITDNLAVFPQANDTGDVSFLGFMVYYSVSGMRVATDDLKEAFDFAGIDENLLPKETSPKDAFLKAVKRAEVRGREVSVDTDGNPIYTNLLIREVRSEGGETIKQLVRENVNSSKETLSYRPVFQIEHTTQGNINYSLLDDNAGEIEWSTLKSIKNNYLEEVGTYDSQAIRRVFISILGTLEPVSMRSSGGIYFVPRRNEEGVRKLERLTQALREACDGADKTQIMAIPMVDRDDYRDVLNENLNQQINSQAGTIIKEISKIKQSGAAITSKRRNAFMERFASLKRLTTSYKGILERNLDETEVSLEMAQAQIVKLFTDIEER